MATSKFPEFRAGGATFALGKTGFLIQFLGKTIRIIRIIDGPDQVPLAEFHERLAKVNGIALNDAGIRRAVNSLYEAIAKAPAVRECLAQ
jgi:hypothetical protein